MANLFDIEAIIQPPNAVFLTTIQPIIDAAEAQGHKAPILATPRHVHEW